MAANSEKIENSKKRIQRLISDLELLKRKTNSALETYSNQPKEEGLKIEDLANLELSGESSDQIKKMITVVESNLKAQMKALEGKVDSFAELESQIEKIRESISGLKTNDIEGGSGVKPEDAEKWNNNCARSEELSE